MSNWFRRDILTTNQQIKNLAKELASFVGKLDDNLANNRFLQTQEESNHQFLQEALKKNKRNH